MVFVFEFGGGIVDDGGYGLVLCDWGGGWCGVVVGVEVVV